MKILARFGFSLFSALPASLHLLFHDSLICPKALRVSLSAHWTDILVKINHNHYYL